MKRYIITEEQLTKIIGNRVQPINENAEAEEVLVAFDRFIEEKGICTLGENVINEDIISDLTDTLKKGVLVASAIVALGLMTPQEAQAETGSKAKKEFVDIFKKRQKVKCGNPLKQSTINKGDKTSSSIKKDTPFVYYKATQKKSKYSDDNNTSVAYFKLEGDKFKKVDISLIEKAKKSGKVTIKNMTQDMVKHIDRGNN